ncbi:MAG: ligase-associated DNA damage response endonuclease PdeM [Sphingobacteriales bacterium]|nr:MAG: ligase-associated DNA damage response endonuclease PdeM [Sphingobacteriales bacterium]
MLDIVLQGEQVKLLAERALLWPSQKTLIVSDLHWGKGAHFRKNGIAIPMNAQQQDETRLANLIYNNQVERLIIAGDLFHSKHNNEVEAFTHWRSGHASLHIDFVTGNHDILPKEKYLDWNMELHTDGLHIGPYYIAHDAPEDCDTFCIHGHLHPAIRISRRGHTAIKLNCFCEDTHRFILPAFGQFTGNLVLEPSEHKHIYVIAETQVLKWK